LTLRLFRSRIIGTIATVANVASHAALGGLSSVASGGGFGSGALSGGFGAVSGMAFGGSAAGTLLGGAISGGVGSVIAGGSFSEGAGQGLISAGLNHAAHSGALGENVAAALLTGKISHLHRADAYALSGNLSAALVGSVRLEAGTVMATVGSDAWQPKLFSEVGLGIGLDAGASAGITKFYYNGKGSNFRIRMLSGLTIQQNISVGAFGANIGASFAVTKLGRGEGIYSIGKSAGLTIPSPLKAGYTYECPTTYFR